jgi:ABC-type phosphate transport system substrate-binding protein
VTLDALRALASGRPVSGVQRLYAPDPNSGLWDAFRAKLNLPLQEEKAAPDVIFLKDDSTVVEAVRADYQALGLVSSFTLPGGVQSRGVRTLGLREVPGAAAVYPDLETTYAGDYPLWSYLYLGCRPRGGIQGSMFVTNTCRPGKCRGRSSSTVAPGSYNPRLL